ncbi:MAG: DUF3500 domain-containing protein, partial [Armatimonadota bacterium]
TASAFRWVSSNPSVATVSDSTTATVSVTAVALGTTTLKVTELESGVSREIPLTVTPVPDPPADNRTLVELANAYINSLSPQQRAATVLPETAENAMRWSNLLAVPDAGTGTNALRNGVAYSTLSSEQKAAWDLLITKALTNTVPTFFWAPTVKDQVFSTRKMERYLMRFDSAHNEDYMYIGFVGTPSEGGKWRMQIGGRLLAINHTYVGNTGVSQTPLCVGREPEVLSVPKSEIGLPGVPGETIVLGGLSTKNQLFEQIKNLLDASQRAQATLEGTFSDFLVGPGKEGSSHFPTGSTNRGLLGSTLRQDQKERLTSILAVHIGFVTDKALAARYQALYVSEIDATYIGYSGSPGRLSAPGDYFRIDGPHVWIEYIVQPGTVPGLPPPNNKVHRSLWRDKVTDYNGEFPL